MAQIFHRSTNFIARFSIYSALFLAALALLVIATVARSPYMTNQNIAREQPVQFSHKHHVGDVGIDCRYCHTSVETSAVAGLPPTKTCMNCHSLLFNNSEYLEPVRESFRSGKSLEWVKVHRLPDFVYFDHSIHVSKGVGCSSCHGQINQMPLVWQSSTMQMEWCLACHRDPGANLRPQSEIFSMDWKPAADQTEQGRKLFDEYKIRSVPELTNCSTCHR